MTTPLSQRFSNQTLLQDSTAPLPVQDVGVFITEEDLLGGERFKIVTNSEISNYPITTDAGKWLAGYFGQDLKPASAVVVHFDPAVDVTVDVALNDAVSKGMQGYAFCYQKYTVDDIAVQQAVATWVQSAAPFDCIAVLLSTDPNNWTQADFDTSIGGILAGLSMARTSVIAVTTGAIGDSRPDGAIIGRMMPTFPELQGVFEQWNYKPLRNVADGGFDAGQRAFMIANNINFVEQYRGTTDNCLFKGRTVTGREIRMQWGADYIDANIEASYYNLAQRAGLMAFDDDTSGQIETILRTWMGTAMDRRLITSFTIQLPDFLSIPASVKTEGVLNLVDVYLGTMNNAIDEIHTTGKWSVGGV